MPTAASTSATWSNTSKPTFGYASKKLRGHECYYCCADDTHGTPVMLAAQKQGIAPEDMIAKVREEHLADFTGFFIGYDNYYSTHSPENKQFSQDIYRALKPTAN